MQIKVIGYSYGYLPEKYYLGFGRQHGVSTTLQGEPIVDFPYVVGEQDSVFPELIVRNQYGWQDGCHEREYRHLVGNVRVLSGTPGDPYKLSYWVLEADEIYEISRKDVSKILKP